MTFAPVETWVGYPPEVNAGRFEMGTGPGSWESAAAIWTELGALVMTSLGTITSNIGLMTGVSLQGLSSVAMAMSSMPFLAWLGEMGALAATNAMACGLVGGAWGTATAGLIPSPVVTANRVAEANAEATNFFGVNTPLIMELNREYGQFWTQNGATMMTYDQAVALATTPKFAPPPPILSTGTGASQVMEKAAQTTAQAANQVSKVGEFGQQVSQNASQGGSQSGTQGIEQVLSTVTQIPQQIMGQGQSLTQGFQQLPQQVGSQLQNLLGNFMSGPQMGEGLEGSFAPALSHSSGGLPLGSSVGSGSGAGIGMGGGGVGSGPLNALSGNNSRVSNVANTTGVTPPIGAGSKSTAMGSGPMGGAPMHGARGGDGGGSRTGKHEQIIAAEEQDSMYGEMSPEEERRLFA